MGEYLSVTTGETGLILVTGDDVATVAELRKVVWSVCVGGRVQLFSCTYYKW